MNERENQERLRQEIQASETRMSNCTHSFLEPNYDAEEVLEGYGSVQDGRGSDPHWSYAGYHTVKKDRWSRECKNCGKKEYTYTQEPVITKYQPKF